MKIFALETDEQKLIKSLLSANEEVILQVSFSAFLFILRSIKALLLTSVFVAVAIGLQYAQLPALWVWVVLGVAWFVIVIVRWITALIDWLYDVIIVTTEEVAIVDQSSLFHVTIRQMNLDNIASVSAETMYWNLLPFGKLHFELKEGVGKTLVLPYIPRAQRVASVISDTIVMFQRRRAALASAMAHGMDASRALAEAAKVAPMPAQGEKIRR